MELQLSGVSKVVRGETHIHATDLILQRGLNVLIGQTLSGKTSLMRLMAGLDQPSTGRILVDGNDVTGMAVQKRNVAMVYQQFINYPSFTVYDNIASPLRRAGIGRQEADRRVREVSAMLGLDPLLDRLPSELSGGQQQRTAMARALVKDAGLLLFDEPLVNLDYKLREQLRMEMRDIFTKRDAIVVYATTEPLEALLLGGHCVVLDQGRVLQSGPTVEVYHHPDSRRVGEVFSDPPINMIGGAVTVDEAVLGDDVRLPLTGHLAGLRPGPYVFGARANHLFLDRRDAADAVIPAVIELAEVNGSETFIHVAYAGSPLVVQEEGVVSVGLKDVVEVFVNPRHIFAFDADGRLVAAPPRARAA